MSICRHCAFFTTNWGRGYFCKHPQNTYKLTIDPIDGSSTTYYASCLDKNSHGNCPLFQEKKVDRLFFFRKLLVDLRSKK